MKRVRNEIRLMLLLFIFLVFPVQTVSAEAVKVISVADTSAATATVKKGWKTVNGKKVYYRNGKTLKGWQTINGSKYYFDKKTGYAYTGHKKIGSYYYYFDSNGKMKKGLIKINGSYYYFNSAGRRQKGWQTINGKKYYFLSNGKAVTSNITLNGKKYYFDKTGKYLRSKNVVIRRAICVAEVKYYVKFPFFGWIQDPSKTLYGCENDYNAMGNMLSKTGYKNRTYGGLNLTKDAIKNGIKEKFKNATENDISLFYYTGHGSQGGTLQLSYGETITAGELADWLSDVPGKIIVILDCCYSGGVINRSNITNTSNVTNSILVEENSFNNEVIRAFQKNEVYSRSGELRQNNKFFVLTACKQNQVSNEIVNGNGERVGYFTYNLVTGSGYDYFSGKKINSAPADFDKNKQITLLEAQKYVNKFITSNIPQVAQAYPQNSAMTLFQR